MTLVTYTADDEYPNCMMCDNCYNSIYVDHFGNKHDICTDRCGAEHGWAGYHRTEDIDTWEV